MNEVFTPEEEKRAARLLGEIGLAGPLQVFPIPGGANNRVYRVETGGRAFLLKLYYTQPDDPRDRLGAEVAFTQFLHRHGVAAAPRLYAWSRESNMALFEFIEGRKPAPEEVSRTHVLESLAFVRQVNRQRGAADAAQLPAASEACFSLTDHLACVERRVQKLAAISGATPEDREARKLVEEELSPQWRRLVQAIERHTDFGGPPRDRLLTPGERCLSPSDFGFHNALIDAEGKLKFVDFEYAGWDDPAKLACDFFCQVQTPATPETWEEFADELAALFPQPADVRRRIELLLPVYRVKWCCILLNEFLPAGARRRLFSRGREGQMRKQAQLEKAREALRRVPPTLN